MMTEHFERLDNNHTQTYLEKIACIGYEDPYCMKDCSTKIADLPPVLYPDIVNYLVFSKRAFSMDQLKAYKGLESYKAASSGCVRELRSKRIGEHIVVLGKVLHSQRLNEKQFNPWIICESSGAVNNAHCDCVAGLGETCTHVSALLFFIDNVVRPTSSVEWKSVTDDAHLDVPSNKPSAPSKVFDIDSTEPGTSKSQLTDSTSKKGDTSMTRQEIVNFLQTLKDTTRGGSALHLVVSPFNRKIEQETQSKHNFS